MGDRINYPPKTSTMIQGRLSKCLFAARSNSYHALHVGGRVL